MSFLNKEIFRVDGIHVTILIALVLFGLYWFVIRKP